MQQVGRSMRPAPGKQRALILDHAGNVFRHGLPEAEREWSLEDRPRQAGEAPLKRCPECGAIIALAAWHCPECGSVLRAPASTRAESSSRLVAVNRLRVMTYRQALRWAGRDRLRLVARARGYKPGWIWHQLNEQKDGAA